jgi:hypothetical protein
MMDLKVVKLSGKTSVKSSKKLERDFSDIERVIDVKISAETDWRRRGESYVSGR